MTTNKLLRETTLWLMYAMDLTKSPPDTALRYSTALLTEFEPQIFAHQDDLQARLENICGQLSQIDEELQVLSPRWKVQRMAAVDRNLLRLGMWELRHTATPPLIIINACIELAKTYGHQTSPAFVNGLLDQFCKNHNITVS